MILFFALSEESGTKSSGKSTGLIVFPMVFPSIYIRDIYTSFSYVSTFFQQIQRFSTHINHIINPSDTSNEHEVFQHFQTDPVPAPGGIAGPTPASLGSGKAGCPETRTGEDPGISTAISKGWRYDMITQLCKVISYGDI